MRLESLRATILLAMGLQASCVTNGNLVSDDTDDTDDTDTAVTQSCDSVEEATQSNATEVESKGGDWLVCGEIPASGTCLSLEELSGHSFVAENVGPIPTDPDFCGWDVRKVCGPEESVTDECCYVVNLSVICEGRPIRVDGAHALPETTKRDDWLSDITLDTSLLSLERRELLTRLWTESGQAEHASVAAFARFALELLALGAPASLVEEAQQAMGDEIRHARLCFAVASAISGQTIGPAAFPAATASGELDVKQTLIGIVIDGCINETIAAAIAQAESNCAADPTLHLSLDKLAADERRHAALSWKALRWLLSERPELRPFAKTCFESGVRDQWNPTVETHPWTHSWGRLSGLQRTMVIRKTIAKVIAPCAHDLFAVQEKQVA